MFPPRQRFRRLGFYLEGGPGGDVRFDFAVRPEDLQRQEPPRLMVNQTLGGAWAGAFGRGVSTITLSGHPGWRGSSW